MKMFDFVIRLNAKFFPEFWIDFHKKVHCLHFVNFNFMKEVFLMQIHIDVVLA